MATTRMSFARPSFGFARRTAVVLLAGAGVALSPLPAQASAPTTAAVAAAPAATPAAQIAVKVRDWQWAGRATADGAALVDA